MTEKERLQRVNILKQQLTVIQLYRKHFEKIEGKKGVEDRIDNILEELKFLISRNK